MRTANVTKKVPCRCCGYSGWAVRMNGDREEAVPCPFCERGFDVEFPGSGKGPWGEDGFWRGRDPGESLEVLYDDTGGRLPPSERARLAQEARAVVRSITSPPRGRPTLDTLLPDATGPEASPTDEGEQERVA
jgi:hypothetical protein